VGHGAELALWDALVANEIADLETFLYTDEDDLARRASRRDRAAPLRARTPRLARTGSDCGRAAPLRYMWRRGVRARSIGVGDATRAKIWAFRRGKSAQYEAIVAQQHVKDTTWRRWALARVIALRERGGARDARFNTRKKTWIAKRQFAGGGVIEAPCMYRRVKTGVFFVSHNRNSLFHLQWI
jgi:hypothetical protein